MDKPLVSLVGRPNVGKSTLFNRLAGERLAVVHEMPGTTRDRLLAEVEWRGLRFDIVDTGGIDPTGVRGVEPLSIGSAEYISQIRAGAEMAVRDSDLVLFLVDGEAGLTPADTEIAGILRRQQVARDGEPWPPILVVVNKCDNERRRAAAVEFYELGMEDPIPVSALHGAGTGDLLDLVVAALGQVEPEAVAEVSESLGIAIIGRPNVGKSSLLNRILGQDRALVSPIPGTTRDAVDTELMFQDQLIRLIDTAGIRRRGKIKPGVEQFSVLRAVKAMERADVVLLMIDATEGVTSQDTHIAGMALEKLKSVVVLVNKWDLVPKDAYTMDYYREHVRAQLNFLPYVPVLFISALTGQRAEQVLPTALRAYEARMVRIPTGDLNRIVGRALSAHAPPSKAGRRLKIYYAAQVRVDPPTFLFHVNDPGLMHFTYERFLENRIREHYDFFATPLRFSFRRRARPRGE
jgi:GTP-binding protein